MSNNLSKSMIMALLHHAREDNQWAKNEASSKALVRRGMLAVTGGSIWNRYTITDAGRAALAASKSASTKET